MKSARCKGYIYSTIEHAMQGVCSSSINNNWVSNSLVDTRIFSFAIGSIVRNLATSTYTKTSRSSLHDEPQTLWTLTPVE